MSNSENEKIKSIIHDLTKSYTEDNNPDHFINKLFKKYKCPYPKKRDLLKVYNSANDEIKDDYEIQTNAYYKIEKHVRYQFYNNIPTPLSSWSGIFM